MYLKNYNNKSTLVFYYDMGLHACQLTFFLDVIADMHIWLNICNTSSTLTA